MQHLLFLYLRVKPIKKLLKALLLSPAIALSCFVALRAQSPVSLSSPDGSVTLKLDTKEQQLNFQVQANGQRIAGGNIGFAFGEQQYGRTATRIETISQHRHVRKRLATRGNHNQSATLKNEYHFKVHSLGNKNDFDLWVNLYNDGIAYRYGVVSNGLNLTRALSHIRLPDNASVWYQQDVNQYEGNFSTSLCSALKDSLKLGMPLTVQYPNGSYAAIMEADIFGFAGTYLSHYKNKKTLDFTLAGPVSTPKGQWMKSGWKIVTFSRDLNGLVNNDILRDVMPAPDKHLFADGKNTDWIRPGKSLWTWMSRKRDVTPENIRKFTDMAASMHIAYNLIDDGWVRWQAPGKDHWQILQEEVDYARSKGVGIWVWQAYPPHNGTPGLQDTSYMRQFFEKCAALGVKGMKIDFINRESQPEIAFYERVARAAARYHLMVDFHGANKGTGMEYTYPNILTQEGVRGLEQQDNSHWPFLNTVLPFTRYLSGPADYTPLSFADYASSTTLAHQTATAAIFTSPFLCLGADPDDLSRSIALPFVQQIPATWDKTIVLKESKIGEVAVFARKKGDDWYLAVINGAQARTITVPVSFLGRGKYHLSALKDALSSRTSALNKQDNIKKGFALEIALPSGGGYLGIFKK